MLGGRQLSGAIHSADNGVLTKKSYLSVPFKDPVF